MVDAAGPPEVPSGFHGGVAFAAADASRVCQSLENLRLDVEAVFDKHRELLLKPTSLPQRSIPPTLASTDKGQDLLFHPVGIQQTPRTSRGSDETELYLKRPIALPNPRMSVASTMSVGSVENMPISMRRLKRERDSFMNESNTPNWMHTLVEETQTRAPTEIQRQMSARLNRSFTPRRQSSNDFIPRLVRRTDFELVRAMMMILDAMLVVWEMQDAARRATSSLHSTPDGIRDTVFFTVLLDTSCVLFMFDLCLRFAAGQFDPINSAAKGWQTFQVVVVIAQLLQTIGQHSHRHQRSHSRFRVVLAMFSTLRLARVLSLVIVTDVIRQHRSFRELRIMVLSLTGAVKSMVWSSLLVFMILLIFGTVLSEGALAFLTQNGPPAVGGLEGSAAPLWARFGSLFDAVLTLFQVISGGVDWEVLWQNLGTLGWEFRGLLLLYIGFSLIAVLNVVTAVMFESTLLRCKADRGLAVQSELIEKRDYLTAMRDLFEELDDENAGEISQEQMRRRMKEPEIGAYFSQLGVDSDQVGKLFHLLDSNKSGTLDSEEFMFGCLKLRGEAKRVDVAVLHRELIWMHEALEILTKQMRLSTVSSNAPTCISQPACTQFEGGDVSNLPGVPGTKHVGKQDFDCGTEFIR
jgi:hypothetical protein